MSEFAVPLSNIQISLPSFCSGILLAGFILYLYMTIIFREKSYKTILFCGILALMFVGSEIFVILFGAFNLNFKSAVQFHRIEQLSGLFFIFALPYLIGPFLKIGDKWAKINNAVILLGIIISAIITILAFTKPELFIDTSLQKLTAKTYQSDFGRGKEGILYTLRDLILAIIILYSFTSIGIHIFKNKKFRDVSYLTIGLFFAISGAVVDIVYVYTSVNYDLFYKFEFSRFSLGLTLLILSMMIGSMKKFIKDSKELEIAHNKLASSEKKYRCIIEGTSDIILTMTETLDIISTNRSAHKNLLLPKNKNNSFWDIIKGTHSTENLNGQIIESQIEQLLKKGTPFQFTSELKDKYSDISKEYDIKMELIGTSEKKEILARISPRNKAAFSHFIESESVKLSMGNQLFSVEDVSDKITYNLNKYISERETNQIRIGLREIIVNAIEHGNLEITFNEKSNLSMSNEYFNYINQKSKHPNNISKKVYIDYSLDKTKAIYTVTDEGPGFEYHSVMKKITEIDTENPLAHGRGILMSLNIFDEVIYNEQGNSVKLIKYFDRNQK